MGNRQGARENSKNAKIWSLVAIVAGSISIIAVVVFLIVSVVASGSHATNSQY